jgi:hypothetical protein
VGRDLPRSSISIDDVGSILEGMITVHAERRNELPVMLEKIRSAVGEMDPMLKAAVGRALIRKAIDDFDPHGKWPGRL